METFKGTAGPWASHDDEESMATSVVMNDFGDILCVVGTYMTSAEEDYANADLIAAAPELLEALQDLFKNYKQLADSGDAGNWRLEDEPVGKKALSAIAKALGK